MKTAKVFVILVVIGLSLVAAKGPPEGGKGKKRPPPWSKEEEDSPAKQQNVGDTYVRVLGRSGKIVIWRELDNSSCPDKGMAKDGAGGEHKDNGDTDNSPPNDGGDGGKDRPPPFEDVMEKSCHTMPIIYQLDELSEVSASGEEVGKTGQTKHSFRNFASQDFEIGPAAEGLMPNSDVTATAFTFSGTLKGLTSTLAVTVFIAQTDGVVTLGNETFDIKKGQVKFSAELKDWQWCSPCTKGSEEEVGQSVDITISIMSKKQPKKKDEGSGSGDKKKRRPKKFDLGGGADASFSSMVKLDDEWTELPEGYPMYKTKGPKQSIVVRIPKFSTSALYDPVTEAGEEPDDGSEYGGGDGSAASPLSSMAVLTVVLSLLATMTSYH